jgi:hypothetical protein
MTVSVPWYKSLSTFSHLNPFYFASVTVDTWSDVLVDRKAIRICHKDFVNE